MEQAPPLQLTTAIISRASWNEAHNWVLPQPNFELRFANTNEVVPPHNRYLQVVRFDRFSIATTHPEPLGLFGLAYEDGLGQLLGNDIDSFLQRKLERPLLFAADFNMKHPLVTLPKMAHDLKLHDVFTNKPTRPRGGHPDHMLYSPEWQVTDSGIVLVQSDHYYVGQN